MSRLKTLALKFKFAVFGFHKNIVIFTSVCDNAVDTLCISAFVLAVDLPSGINTDTGEVAEGAAHADLTVTFDSYKPLHMAETSAPLCGKIVCADIGIRDEWHPEF